MTRRTRPTRQPHRDHPNSLHGDRCNDPMNPSNHVGAFVRHDPLTTSAKPVDPSLRMFAAIRVQASGSS